MTMSVTTVVIQHPNELRDWPYTHLAAVDEIGSASLGDPNLPAIFYVAVIGDTLAWAGANGTLDLGLQAFRRETGKQIDELHAGPCFMGAEHFDGVPADARIRLYECALIGFVENDLKIVMPSAMNQTTWRTMLQDPRAQHLQGLSLVDILETLTLVDIERYMRNVAPTGMCAVVADSTSPSLTGKARLAAADVFPHIWDQRMKFEDSKTALPLQIVDAIGYFLFRNSTRQQKLDTRLEAWFAKWRPLILQKEIKEADLGAPLVPPMLSAETL